mgnify:CR=1 FL=1
MTSSWVMTSSSEILNILTPSTKTISTRPGVDQSSILKIVARKSVIRMSTHYIYIYFTQNQNEFGCVGAAVMVK